VVVLARTPDKVARVLGLLGAQGARVVHGDVLDQGSVERALDGVQGVLNASGAYSLDPKQRQAMWRTNVDGARIVLDAAVARRCDPIVHVSSTVALWPLSQAGPPQADPPVGTLKTAYSSSKVAAEAYARRLQGDAPVVLTYPGSAWGPHDPGPGEMVALMRGFLGNRFPFIMRGAALSIVDVRWLARAHAALFSRGLGPRRLQMGGTMIRWPEIFALFRRLTGRRLPQLLPVPRALGLLTGRIADLFRMLLGVRLPLTYESVGSAFWTGQTDDGPAIALAGPHPPVEDTLRDAIRWASAAGWIPRRWSGGNG
jgi:nucleoside-diphosphate-sugar epimerase